MFVATRYASNKRLSTNFIKELKRYYLVAKERYAHGCIAFKTTQGKHLLELKRELNKAVGYKGVQLVTISRPTAYGEYTPYHFVDIEEEFKVLVKGLRP